MAPKLSNNSTDKRIALCRKVNTAIILFIALFFLLAPAAITLRDLCDPGLRTAKIPQSAWRLHRNISPKMESWARKRLDTTRATELSVHDISGTEWPLFGSVFYLRGTEALQDAWEKDHSLSPVAPNVYAREAIDVITRLVIDPNHANWVKIHWGDKYLSTENVFYRMLVIGALTSHARLTGDKQYLPMLRDQVDGLSNEFDASPHGLLNDYPGECYPCDILMAIAMINRADKVLGTDHSAFVRREIRAFEGKVLDARGMVPYMADPVSGEGQDFSRGCGNSAIAIFAPEIWPEWSVQWYKLYTQHFWQEIWLGAGFRETPKEITNWPMDVDSGPIIKGYGFAACAFGVGAARVNNHFEHAYPLAAQMIAISCPLPNGTWLFPRILSNAADAPYLGESGILFTLTCLPSSHISSETGVAAVSPGPAWRNIPGLVWLIIGLEIGVGLYWIFLTICSVKKWRNHETPYPELQFWIWAALIAGSIFLLCLGRVSLGLASILAALLLPRIHRRRTEASPAPVPSV